MNDLGPPPPGGDRRVHRGKNAWFIDVEILLPRTASRHVETVDI